MAATDPGREVQFHAGDRTWTLYAGNKALRLIERETGKPFLEAVEALQTGNINLLTTVLWALLQRHHAGLKIDDVDDIIDNAGGWERMLVHLTEAIEKAFPSASDDDAGDSGKAPGTGSSSLQAA